MENDFQNEMVPQSNQPLPSNYPNGNSPFPPGLTPEMVELLKAKARQDAIQQALEQRAAQMQVPPGAPERIIYLRRNLTIAELGLILLLSCGLVTATQAVWNFASNHLPQIEIKVK